MQSTARVSRCCVHPQALSTGLFPFDVLNIAAIHRGSRNTKLSISILHRNIRTKLSLLLLYVTVFNDMMPICLRSIMRIGRNVLWKLAWWMLIIFGVGMMFLSYSAPPALEDSNVSPLVLPHQAGARITAAASKETQDYDQSTIVPEFEESVSGDLFSRAFRGAAIVDFLMGGSQVSLMRGHLPLPPPHSATSYYVKRSVE